MKIPTGFSIETDKLMLIFIWKEPRRAKTILEKNKIGGLT